MVAKLASFSHHEMHGKDTKTFAGIFVGESNHSRVSVFLSYPRSAMVSSCQMVMVSKPLLVTLSTADFGSGLRIWDPISQNPTDRFI